MQHTELYGTRRTASLGSAGAFGQLCAGQETDTGGAALFLQTDVFRPTFSPSCCPTSAQDQHDSKAGFPYLTPACAPLGERGLDKWSGF